MLLRFWLASRLLVSLTLAIILGFKPLKRGPIRVDLAQNKPTPLWPTEAVSVC